ncbi:MAG: helix-turn-helix transcriptional regulator [Eggerthellaceae bacterium]|nr:helix-turn-helix transcriptional regulator [Eggerthellaceae bacterium]
MAKDKKDKKEESSEKDAFKKEREQARKEKAIRDGGNIKIARKSLGLSKSDLAKKVGLTKDSITAIEDGDLRGVDIPTMRKICNVLGGKFFYEIVFPGAAGKCNVEVVDGTELINQIKDPIKNIISMFVGTGDSSASTDTPAPKDE